MMPSTTTTTDVPPGSHRPPLVWPVEFRRPTVLDEALCRLPNYLGLYALLLDAGSQPVRPNDQTRNLRLRWVDIDHLIDTSGPGGARKQPADFFAHSKFRRWRHQFDAIILHFPYFLGSRREFASMICTMATWTRPGGLMILANIPAESLLDQEALNNMRADSIESCPSGSAGQGQCATLVTTTGLRQILQQAGLSVLESDRGPLRCPGFARGSGVDSVVITAWRTCREPLFGPWPLPWLRIPRPLFQRAYAPFFVRYQRSEFPEILRYIHANDAVLDFGCGYAVLAQYVAERIGKAYAVEPDTQVFRTACHRLEPLNVNVDISSMTRTETQFPDGSFNVVVAVRVLEYVSSVYTSVAEMHRVLNRSTEKPRIIIVQAAPDNQIIDLLNTVCSNAVASNDSLPTEQSAARFGRIEHQGVLLAEAANALRELGMDTSFHRVSSRIWFPEEDVQDRCAKASEVLANLWYSHDPRVAQSIASAMVPLLEKHFSKGAKSIEDQGVMMIAQPRILPG